jgi:hypothetical protein
VQLRQNRIIGRITIFALIPFERFTMQLANIPFAYLFVSFVLIATTLPLGNAEQEQLCPAFEASGETPTCETCVEALCGWTDDDGDCLKDCNEVNDGAACVELGANQVAADVCGKGNSTAEEEMCAAFEGSSTAPTCEACVEAGCGWTDDDGDCLKDCNEVNDGAKCVSTKEACGSGGITGTEDEEMCAAFEGSSTAPTCETCVEAGCGWTDDDGDCLKDCNEVNDGAACVSTKEGCNPGSGSSAAIERFMSVIALMFAPIAAFI